jgi:hypothetical protein
MERSDKTADDNKFDGVLSRCKKAMSDLAKGINTLLVEGDFSSFCNNINFT